MSFQMDQFKLSDQAGNRMNPNGQAIEVKISKDLSASTPFEGGYAAKFHLTEVGDLPVITPLTLGDSGHGVVLFNMQKSKRYANERVTFAMDDSIVSMVASTAIQRGAKVYYNPTTNTVSTTTGASLGKTIDIASANGDIVRVLISPTLS